MEGAHGVLLSIAGGSDLGLFEINDAASQVQEAAHEDANIIFGTVIDDNLGDEVRVTVIAAGFDAGTPSPRQQAATPAAVSKSSVAAAQAGETARPDAKDPLFGSAPERAGNPFSEPAPRRNSVRFDDDDVDVPDFMK